MSVLVIDDDADLLDTLNCLLQRPVPLEIEAEEPEPQDGGPEQELQVAMAR